MSKIAALLIALVLDCLTWDEATRPRRRDDPIIGRLRQLNRQAGIALLVALGLSMAWGVTLLAGALGVAPSSSGPFGPLWHVASRLSGWLAAFAWIAAILSFAKAYTFAPTR